MSISIRKIADLTIDCLALALGLLIATPFFLAMAAPFVGGY